jgi:hypothetical protein
MGGMGGESCKIRGRTLVREVGVSTFVPIMFVRRVNWVVPMPNTFVPMPNALVPFLS